MTRTWLGTITDDLHRIGDDFRWEPGTRVLPTDIPIVGEVVNDEMKGLFNLAVLLHLEALMLEKLGMEELARRMYRKSELVLEMFHISLRDTFEDPSGGMLTEIRKGWKVVWVKKPRPIHVCVCVLFPDVHFSL